MKPVLLTHPCDTAVLAVLHKAAFTDAWSAEWIASLMAQPGAFAYLAKGEGFVLARAAGGDAEVLTLAVTPQARSRGVGLGLMAAAAGRAFELGAKTMFLEVGTANAPAQKLYQKLGFREVGRRKGYYGKAGGDARVLGVKLPLSRVGKPGQLD
jgi:ribosomal-protein-alanine N-acetyltransferase